MRRTAAEAAVTRATVLAAARVAFADEGYAATSLDAIAAQSGVTRGAVHHHFGDKRTLFIEVFSQLEQELDRAVVGAAIAAPPDPMAQMRAGCRALFEFFGRPEYRQIALADAPAVLGLLAWYEIDRGLGMSTMRIGVQSMADAGHIEPGRVEAVTVLLYGALTEAAINLQTPNSPSRAEEFIDTVQLFLDGLAPPVRTRASRLPNPRHR